jgi:hypothetical protein
MDELAAELRRIATASTGATLKQRAVLVQLVLGDALTPGRLSALYDAVVAGRSSCDDAGVTSAAAALLYLKAPTVGPSVLRQFLEAALLPLLDAAAGSRHHGELAAGIAEVLAAQRAWALAAQVGAHRGRARLQSPRAGGWLPSVPACHHHHHHLCCL